MGAFMPRIKSSFYLMITLAALSLSSDGRCYWIGDPGAKPGEDSAPISVLFENGTREMTDVDTGSLEADVRARRFYVQGRVPVAGFAEFFARAVPTTMRVNVENSPFNPRLWGGGLGVRVSPPVRWGGVGIGVLAAWDWNFGSVKRDQAYNPANPLESHHDRMNWTEGTMAAGAGWRAAKWLNFYGGYSYIRTKLYTKVDGTKINWESKENGGGFAGSEIIFPFPVSLSAEFHFGNEKTAALALNFGFSGD
jgi:hypothetical protein